MPKMRVTRGSDASGGGGGGLTTWVAGTYTKGQLVETRGLILTPRVASSAAAPFSAQDAGGVGTGSYSRNSVVSTTGEEVVLVNNGGSDGAAVVSTLTLTLPAAFSITGEVAISGAADDFQFGILDAAQAATVVQGGGLNGQTGFYGVSWDMWNNRYYAYANGAQSGTPVAGDPRTAGGAYETRTVDFSIANGLLTMTWAGRTISVPAPSFTSFRLAFGARSGGSSGVFKIRNTPTLNLLHADWRRLVATIDQT